MRPVNSPSSRAGPTRVTMRALQRDCPSLSSQQSTVAPGNPIPPNVTSWIAKRTCLVVTGPRYHLHGETLDGPDPGYHRIHGWIRSTVPILGGLPGRRRPSRADRDRPPRRIDRFLRARHPGPPDRTALAGPRAGDRGGRDREA